MGQDSSSSIDQSAVSSVDSSTATLSPCSASESGQRYWWFVRRSSGKCLNSSIRLAIGSDFHGGNVKESLRIRASLIQRENVDGRKATDRSECDFLVKQRRSIIPLWIRSISRTPSAPMRIKYWWVSLMNEWSFTKLRGSVLPRADGREVLDVYLPNKRTARTGKLVIAFSARLCRISLSFLFAQIRAGGDKKCLLDYCLLHPVICP